MCSSDLEERSLVHVCAAHGRAELLELFLSKTKDRKKAEALINQPERGEWGGAPIHSASAGGHLECVSVLLTAGANANAKTERDLTPLHYACSKGFADVAKKLIEAGADVNARDLAGNAPAHRAASQGRLAALKALFENEELGTNIDARDNQGQTPLLVAAEAGQDECAILLAKLGANVNAVDNEKIGVPERLRGVLRAM